jgi:hypothetical protein
MIFRLTFDVYESKIYIVLFPIGVYFGFRVDC